MDRFKKLLPQQLGRVVFGKKIEEGTHSFQLDLAGQNISSGEYFVRVVSAGGIVTRMLVVSK